MVHGVVALQTCIGFVGLLLLARCWSNYRLDSFRHRMFVLRDELFSVCLSGDLPFDDPANRTLRWMLDSTIRFAHKLTLTRIILIVIAQYFRPELRVRLFDWESITEHLPTNAKDRVDGIRTRMTVLMIWHIITGSPVSVTFVGMAIAFWTVKNGTFALLRGSAAAVLRQIADLPPIVSAVRAIEVQASDNNIDQPELAYQV